MAFIKAMSPTGCVISAPIESSGEPRVTHLSSRSIIKIMEAFILLNLHCTGTLRMEQQRPPHNVKQAFVPRQEAHYFQQRPHT